jgi:hypothetical protein
MAVDHAAKLGDFQGVGKLAKFDHVLIAAAREFTGDIQHVSNAAGHACRKVAACVAENDYPAALHVFTAMVAHGFHNGMHARVADAETFASHAANVNFAACSSV